MGRGGIRRRGENYQIHYYDSTGKRHFETIGPKKKEAEEKLEDRLQEIRNKKFNLQKSDVKGVLFKDFLQKWDGGYAQFQLKMGELKGSTYTLYQGYMTSHLIPFFGKSLLEEINPNGIREFMSYLVQKGLSPKTVNNILVCLKGILKYACREGYLKEDPGQFIKRLDLQEKEVDILTTEEIKLFLQHVRPQYYPFFLCAVLTGLRQGELLGLQWQDIDFVSNQIHVRRSYYRGTFVTPKSKKSRRAVNIPSILADTLRGLTSSYLKDGQVFCNQDGSPLLYKTVEREFHRALRLAGLRRVKFHSLRHSYTALLIDQGENLKYVQSQLGHASITTTIDIYGHVMPEVNKEAPKRLEKALFGDTLSNQESVVSMINPITLTKGVRES